MNKKRCEYCAHSKRIYAQDGWSFIGCTHPPFRGKRCAEIKWEDCPIPVEERPVYCIDCQRLMFSDFYGECAEGHKGIVNPNDTCKFGERKIV